METLTFKLQEDNFEGPLDLLLYLVGKNKMNLYDINIMELIEQYTAAIQTMQADKLEVSSEFIDMAAHLVQMKSALLLPRSPEAERMKAELTGRLIEYSTCKQVAAELGSRARICTPRCASPKNRKARRNIPANRIPTGWCRRGSA
ncbi:MAG: segregation and condensation protein A [Subdoligranulum sp.]